MAWETDIRATAWPVEPVVVSRSIYRDLTHWSLTLLLLVGLIINEHYGPIVLGAGIGGWCIYVVGYMERARAALREGGLAVWLMPLLAMASITWSEEPEVTFRAALENLVMVGCLVLVARQVSPRAFMILLFLALVGVALASIPVNNMTFDFTTGKVTASGIFGNKNTFSLTSAVLVLVAGAILLDTRVTLWLRFLTLPMIGLGVVQNLDSNSVAATLALAIASIWGVTLFMGGRRHVRALIAMGVIGLAIGALLAMTLSEELLAMVGKDRTLTGRTELWTQAERIIPTVLPLGVGYNAFWVKNHPLAEQLWAMMGQESGTGFSFHNLFYEVTIELGVPGVIIGTLVIHQAVLSAMRWLRRANGAESIFFFSLLAFILIIQTQGYDLFAVFDVFYAMFVMVQLYAENWRWRERYPVISNTQTLENDNA